MLETADLVFVRSDSLRRTRLIRFNGRLFFSQYAHSARGFFPFSCMRVAFVWAASPRHVILVRNMPSWTLDQSRSGFIGGRNRASALVSRCGAVFLCGRNVPFLFRLCRLSVARFICGNSYFCALFIAPECAMPAFEQCNGSEWDGRRECRCVSLLFFFFSLSR